MNGRLLRDDGLLLCTAAIWGFAFVAQRAGMAHVGPFTFNGVRFALGALSLLPLLLLRRGRPAAVQLAPAAPPAAAGSPALSTGPATKRDGILPCGLLLGAVLFAAASLQQVGILYTTAGKAGFITGLYVVLVPLSGLLWGQRAGWGRWAGALLALAGLYFLSISSSFSIGRGDLLVLLSALFWTAHVQLIGRFAPRVRDPILLALLQFAVCALLSLGVAVAREPLHLGSLLRAALPILYGGVGSVGVAYTLQVVVQRTAHPAHVAIILSLEGVFAVLGGWLILGEALSPRGLLGCALMLGGMLASQATAFAVLRAAPRKQYTYGMGGDAGRRGREP
jgi:drug/metabolite transporter (DMT)-like permease